MHSYVTSASGLGGTLSFNSQLEGRLQTQLERLQLAVAGARKLEQLLVGSSQSRRDAQARALDATSPTHVSGSFEALVASLRQAWMEARSVRAAQAAAAGGGSNALGETLLL